MVVSKVSEFFNRLSANSSRWDIDDALECNVMAWIVDEMKVRQKVFDFTPWSGRERLRNACSRDRVMAFMRQKMAKSLGLQPSVRIALVMSSAIESASWNPSS